MPACPGPGHDAMAADCELDPAEIQVWRLGLSCLRLWRLAPPSPLPVPSLVRDPAGGESGRETCLCSLGKFSDRQISRKKKGGGGYCLFLCPPPCCMRMLCLCAHCACALCACFTCACCMRAFLWLVVELSFLQSVFTFFILCARALRPRAAFACIACCVRVHL